MKENELFSKVSLRRLIIPLVIEQALAITIGMADTIMVSSVGEAAVAGVSLVDMLNNLFFNMFAALGTGGAVVVAQLLGAKERKRGCDAARQLMLIAIIFSVILMTVVIVLRQPLLRLLFGSIDPDVMDNAVLYLWISALSYPFLALYNAGAALFRAQGNSRVSMMVALIVNIVNIGGNALLIYGLHYGVAGAAIASAVARLIAAAVIFKMLLNPHHEVSLRTGRRFYPNRNLILRILNIGVPNGLENSLFQLGRVLVVSMIALFGTTQVAANAVANNLDAVGIIPGQALNLAMITVVGQCVGARDYVQARRNAVRLMKITYLFTACTCTLVLLTLPLTMRLYQLSGDTMKLAVILIVIHNGAAMLLWPPSFTLPNALRAANDVRYTMFLAIASMWILRIGVGYILAVVFQWGAIGIWIAMVADWICRTLFFVFRYRGNKWEQHIIVTRE